MFGAGRGGADTGCPAPVWHEGWREAGMAFGAGRDEAGGRAGWWGSPRGGRSRAGSARTEPTNACMLAQPHRQRAPAATHTYEQDAGLQLVGQAPHRRHQLAAVAVPLAAPAGGRASVAQPGASHLHRTLVLPLCRGAFAAASPFLQCELPAPFSHAETSRAKRPPAPRGQRHACICHVQRCCFPGEVT